LLVAIRVRHGQVPDSGLGSACEGLGDDGAMTLGMVALVAEQCDGTGGGPSQGIEQRALLGEVLSKIAEEAREITVLSQSVAYLPWRAEGTFVGILDPGL
jgi:hypothetical protein